MLLYSRHAVLKFSLESRKVEQIPVMKALGRINRITFEQHEDGGTWILWVNGKQELTMDARVEGASLGDGGK